MFPGPDKPALRTRTLDRWAMSHIAINEAFPPDLAVKICDFDVFRDKAMFTHAAPRGGPTYSIDLCLVIFS